MDVVRRVRPKTLLLSAVAGLTGGFLLAIPLSRSLAPTSEAPLLLPVSNPFSAWSGFGNREILVLGLDDGGGNTDAIFTLKVEGGRTSITQIPRDSYIDSHSFGPVKANALYAYGGHEAVKAELTRLMGRPIDHHILVNLNGIRTLSDLVGGVEVDVPKRLYYRDDSGGLLIDLQPGPQLLKGRELEGFLRWRQDEEGDLGRLARQQLVLKSLFSRLTRPDHLVKLPALIKEAGNNLETDLGAMELGGLITAMGLTELETERLDARPFDRNGISYLDTAWPAQESDGDSMESGSSRYRFLY
ncbi:MAG: Regulatory protein MsrR [Cyanobium sp. ARS6]|nr:MAG: Regulatory protein MsrR [Cyanobium sp. ARS6]